MFLGLSLVNSMYFMACRVWILLGIVAVRWKKNGGHKELEQLNERI